MNRNLLITMLVTGLCICLASCKEIGSTPTPKPTPDPVEGKKDLAIISMVANPDGMSGSCYMNLIDGSKQAKIDNQHGVPVGFGMPPVAVFGHSILTPPAYGQSNDLLRHDATSDGVLKVGGKYTFPDNSRPSHGTLLNDQKAYICTSMGYLEVINPKTMQHISTIDLKQYAEPGIQVPQFGTPVISEGKMYLPLWQIATNMMPATPPMIDMLVIDTSTDKVLKRIKAQVGDLAIPCYPRSVQKGSFVDEKGDIYFIAAGMFSMIPNYKSGIFRIKKGTMEIDPDYIWVMNDQDIEGETARGTWLLGTHYAGNGKLYGYLDVPSYWEKQNMPNWFKDRSLVVVEMDIYNKTIKKLPIPRSSAYAATIAPYHGKYLFASWAEQSSGFYLYDPQTGKASEKAHIETVGIPYWCQGLTF